MNLALLLVICGFLVLLSAVIHHFKLYNLLSGYSTLPPELREKVDWNAFTLYFRNVYIIISLLLITGWFVFHIAGLMRWMPLLFLAGIITGSVMIVIRGQRITKEANRGNATNLRIVRNLNILLVIVGGFSVLMILVIFILGFSEVRIEQDNESITLKGMYSSIILKQDIQKIELIETLPLPLQKINGFVLGNTFKGKFKFNDNLEVTLFVSNSREPVIKISTVKGIFFINFKDPGKTSVLYSSLLN